MNELRTAESQRRIVKAIEEAELNTSGEIRVHIESLCKVNPMNRAFRIFKQLKMYDTAEHNAVLIYVAYQSRKLAIIGDSGIHSKVPDNYWDGIKVSLAEDFSAGHYVEGICKAVMNVGNNLKEFFPYQSDDINEQSNEVSFGE